MSTRLEVLQMLVSKAPDDPFPYYCLAQEYRSRGLSAEALGAFDTLRGRFPDYVPQYLMAAQLSLETLDRAAARVWTERGIAAARSRNDQHALGELESFLASLVSPDAP